MTKVQRVGIPAFTGIRGLASLWILFFHIQLDAGRYFGLSGLEKLPLLRFGWHAVDLFFMLSGFILMYAHAEDFRIFRRYSFVRFAKLRFARIYPLNTVLLFLIGLLALSDQQFIAWMRTVNDPQDFSSGAFFRTLCLANRWFLPKSGSYNEPVWSLSLEILGYALFPFLAYLVVRLTLRSQVLALIFASLASFAYFSFVRHMLFTNMIGQIATVRMLCCFTVGIAIFRLWTLTECNGNNWPSGLAIFAIVGIGAACIVPLGEPVLNLLFAVLLFALAFQQGVVSLLLSNQVMMFLGRISFPLYLIHGLVFWWLRYFMLSRLISWSRIETSMLLVAGLVTCIALAAILHFAVEKPAHILGRRWAAIGSGEHWRIKQTELQTMRHQNST